MTGPPPKPLGMSDFFALEAGEYLERLDGLLAAGDSPNADELVRLARALRGSALMANHHAIARTAAALEALARAVREGRRAWDAQTKQLAVRGVDDLKIFVRRAPAWSDADTAKAEALAQELEQLAGRPSAQVRAAEALGLDAGAPPPKVRTSASSPLSSFGSWRASPTWSRSARSTTTTRARTSCPAASPRPALRLWADWSS